MARVSISLGDPSFGQREGFLGYYRAFEASTRKLGAFTGQILGNTGMIRVEFGSPVLAPAVNVVTRNEVDRVEYLDTIKDDRSARKTIKKALGIALRGEAEPNPPIFLSAAGMEN